MAQQPPEAPDSRAPDSPAPDSPAPDSATPKPPAPRPGPPAGAPRPAPPPAATVGAAPADGVAAEASDASSWGRVDADGTVFVRDRDGAEREVGQWPEGAAAEALTLYVHRFEGLAVEVDLLERRVRQGALAPDEARRTIAQVRESIVGAQAVGDLERLVERLDSLAPVLAEQQEQRRVARQAKQERARQAKESIVAEAEQLAVSADWRGGADRLRELMDSWKAQARIDKASDEALWRRFSSARSAYSRRRKQHFAQLHEQHDEARAVKVKLAAEAETLADSTDWGATAGRFRDLMREWKAAGSAGRREEEALWQRFRTAQDAFFTARDAANAKVDAQFAANAEVKRAVLAEAEALVPVTDVAAARAAFRDIAERWEAAGKVPRDQMRELEDRMRAVESALRTADEERWRRNNPEAHARAAATVAQLEKLLADLRAKAAAAEAAGDDRRLRDAQAAIEAREAWLEQARRALADFTP